MSRYEYGLLFDLASYHGCCKPSTTAVLPPVLSPVLYTECDAQNVLFTVVASCVDDAKVEQEAGQLLFAVAIVLFVTDASQSTV